MKILRVFKYSIILIVLVLFFISNNYLFSQVSSVNDFKTDYVPLSNYKIDSLKILDIIKKFEKRYESLKIGKSKSEKNLMDEFYGENHSFVKRLDSLNFLMYNDTLSHYLQSVLNRIVVSNSSLQGKEYLLFTRRSGIPNAVDLGEGIIFVNLDIISKQSTESQIAYVICHELAHDYYNHVLKRMQETIGYLTDKDIQKKIKKISKQEYNTLTDYYDLVYKVAANRSSYSRRDETLADSLGFSFYCKSGYNPKDAISTLIELDSLDNPMFKKRLNYQNHFSFANLPFNESLLYEDTTDLNWQGNIDYEIPDSLKTHPDCKLRAQNLEKIVIQSDSTKSYNNDLSFFNSLSMFELIQFYTDIKYYSLSLYYALSFQDIYPENIYLKCMVIECLYGITESLKNHTFSKSVDLPSDKRTVAYNEILRFLNNATFSDLDKIAREYYKANVAPYSGQNSYAAYIETLLKYRDLNNPDMADSIIDEYKSKFSNFFFVQKLTDRLKYTNP